MGVKKVKISSVKRALHIKSKKRFSKPQPNKKSETSSAQSKSQKDFFTQKSKKKQKPKKQIKQRHVEDFDEDDADEIVENITDVIDPDDLELLELSKKTRKRKYENGDDGVVDDDEIMAKRFEIEHAEKTIQEKNEKKHIVNLLPIKSKDGEIITRTAKVDYKPKENEKSAQDDEENMEGEGSEDEAEEYEDSDDDVIKDNENLVSGNVSKKVISTADLLILRQQEIEKQKYRIGIICSGILEKPEDKIKNFKALFDLMDEQNENGVTNLLSVRKVAMMSIAEVFKDILPEYRVGQVDKKMTLLRKTTLERMKYENALLQYLKKYLQKLEKITSSVTRKGGGQRTQQNIKLAEVAVQCLCDILLAHPYFNYVQNIAQLLVYMLNCQYQKIRSIVNQCFSDLFKIDPKFDMTLFIIRRINHLIKTKSNNVHIEMITCFMSLKIKSINLDAEKENELKQKKLESHRSRLLNLSKRERKRRKKLAELDKELQETQAEENKQTKHYKLTEITKMLFTIYFRLLKNDPNSKLLSACLEGLAEFSHVINLDFFSDLIEILNRLLEENELGYREQLHCIQTIFSILSGQGEVLNIDPLRFYGHLYRNLFVVNCGKNHDDFHIIIQILSNVLIKRRRHITQQRLLAFIKRLIILCLQLLHNGCLSGLGIIKNVMQLKSLSIDIILDTDCSIGTGTYNAELDDPEYCNASCTSLYELTLLNRHYHSIVRKFSANILLGVPATGEGSLPPEISKLTPDELFSEYNSSEMAFNPCIPPPKQCEPNFKRKRHIYLDPTLEPYCKKMISEFSSCNEIFDFYGNFKK